jgi:hypothetical protein
MKQTEKQEFIGGLIASVLVKEGAPIVAKAVKKGLDKMARRPDTKTDEADVKKAAPVVTNEVQKEVIKEVQAQVEHTQDAEPHWQSRNMWGVFFVCIGAISTIYKMWTDGVPQTFDDYWPQITIIAGGLVPLYSRFIAKKPLFR